MESEGQTVNDDHKHIYSTHCVPGTILSPFCLLTYLNTIIIILILQVRKQRHRRLSSLSELTQPVSGRRGIGSHGGDTALEPIWGWG